MTARLLLLTACFLAAATFVARAGGPELAPARAPLAALPVNLGGWQGFDEPRFSDEVLAVLGVDDYVNRTYHAEGELPVSLYVGFYGSQRQGDTIHSPMNCLPGAGWQPMVTQRLRLPVPGHAATLDVNHVIIQKGAERLLVLYWYQSQGRVVASEYWSKFYMVYDAIRTNRSDGALVRVVTPIVSTEPEEAADRRAAAFVQSLFPLLGRYLPS